MSLKREIRRVVQRFGIDIVRYPLNDPLARTVKLLQNHRIDCVIDVGANDGGFASSIRSMGYGRRIISLEPLPGPYESLSGKAKRDGNWDALRCAAGNAAGEVTVNVSGNAGLSSSVLPMLSSHTKVAPNSRYVGSEIVRQERLDELLPRLGVAPENRTFLKIDVQGYEGAVLDGASRLFSEHAIAGLQLELSLQPLYQGGIGYREVLDRAEDMDFTLVGLDPVFADPATGELLQLDAVFFAQRLS